MAKCKIKWIGFSDNYESMVQVLNDSKKEGWGLYVEILK